MNELDKSPIVFLLLFVCFRKLDDFWNMHSATFGILLTYLTYYVLVLLYTEDFKINKMWSLILSSSRKKILCLLEEVSPCLWDET